MHNYWKQRLSIFSWKKNVTTNSEPQPQSYKQRILKNQFKQNLNFSEQETVYKNSTSKLKKQQQVEQNAIASLYEVNQQITADRDTWKENFEQFQIFHNQEVISIKAQVIEESKLIMNEELKDQALVYEEQIQAICDQISATETKLFEANQIIEQQKFENQKLLSEKNQIQRSLDMSNDMITKINAQNQKVNEQKQKSFENQLLIVEKKSKREVQNEYQIKLTLLEKEVSKLEVKVSQLETNYKIATTDLNLVQDEKNKQSIENAKLQSRIFELESLIQTQSQAQAYEADDKCQKLEMEFEQKLMKFQNEIYNLECSNINHQQENSKLKNDIQVLEQRYDQLQKSPIEIIKEVEVIKEVPIPQSQNQEQTKRERKIIQQNADLVVKFENFQKTIQDLENQNLTLIQKISSHNTVVQDKDNVIQDLNEQLQSQIKEVEKISQAFIKFKSEQASLSSIVTSYKKYIGELENIVAQKNKDLIKNISQLDNQIHAQETSISRSTIKQGMNKKLF